MADEYDIRCPYCLRETRVPTDIAVDKTLHCDRCDRGYEFQNALRSTPSEPVATDVVLNTVAYEERIKRILLIGGGASLLCLWALSVYAHDLDGPSFLMLYFFAGIASLIISNIVRWSYVDTFFVSSIAAGFYILLGVIRYVDGTSQGMSNFSAMFVFMVIGFFFFFIRSQTEGGKSKTTFFGCCGGGCGSSCGGGCGGGCGGCGG